MNAEKKQKQGNPIVGIVIRIYRAESEMKEQE